MAKNKFFLTTKGFNAEVVVAAPLAYSTQSTYANFVSNAAEGEIGIFNADTQALISGATSIGSPGTPILLGSTTGGSMAAATYYYKIVAVNAAGTSLPGGEGSVTTTGSTSSVSLSWTPVAGATSYRIYRGVAADTQTGYQVSGAPLFTDTSASAGTAGTTPVTSTATAASPAPIGANIFIAQKRDALVHQTTPFKVAAGIVTPTAYVAPVKQVTTLSTFPTAVAGAVWTVTLFDTTPAAQPYPSWSYSYTLKAADTIALGVAGLLALINSATDPQDYAYGKLVVATSGGSGDTSTLILTSVDFNRPFRVATRDGISYTSSGITVTATTPFKAGIGTYDNVSEVEGEGIIYSGVTTNYPGITGANPDEFGTATKFALASKTYNTYLINFFESERSPLPLERHFQKKYYVLFCPSSGTTPDATVATILGF